jgi:hypothetical protein
MNMTTTIKQVREAVEQVKREYGKDLDTYQFVFFPDLISESYGGWLLPAECRGSGAFKKSYELHRLIDKLEDRFQDVLHSTVTIDLLAAGNGS